MITRALTCLCLPVILLAGVMMDLIDRLDDLLERLERRSTRKDKP